MKTGMKTGMKTMPATDNAPTCQTTCTCCGDVEWPCFLVLGRCRMCQARRRDDRRANGGQP